MPRARSASQGLVLVVDHEAHARRALVRELRRGKFKALEARSREEALAMLHGTPDILAVVSGSLMRERGGLELLTEVQRRVPSMIRILYSASLVEGQVEAALSDGVVHLFFARPWALGEIAAAIRGLRRVVVACS